MPNNLYDEEKVWLNTDLWQAFYEAAEEHMFEFNLESELEEEDA